MISKRRSARDNSYGVWKGSGNTMKKMKKWGIVAACCLLVATFGLFGCSSSESTETTTPETETEATETEGTQEEGTDATATDYTLLNDGQLTIITSPDYPPFESIENGELEGFEVDLFKAVAERMGLEYNVVQMQFDAIIPAVTAGGQGDVGVSGFSVDPERAKEIDFTDSFYIDDQAVAMMKSSGITADTAAEALNQEDITIAVQTGTTGEAYAQENFPNATVQGYGNSTDCFAAMQSGQADAVCTNLAVVNRMISEAYTDAETVLEVATGEEYAAVVAQDNPGLTAAINEALAELQEDGTIDDLVAQWF